MLSRLIHGGRLTLFIGLMPVVLAFFIGGTLGIIAGYVGGITNTIIMRVVDVFFAFPSVPLAIAISAPWARGAEQPGVADHRLRAPVTRVAEAVTSGVRSLDYIDAARASGRMRRR
ncbi:hypothetical protein FLP41_09325 [Paracoccus marcusii]|uniref:hypothetical protein n=1 Tax=Paracoccus marcusii TaxID=59779 RepID=UPI002ED1419C|nr:hypothetical protein FLP41_09325 [Paracoccus marcusii]